MPTRYVRNIDNEALTTLVDTILAAGQDFEFPCETVNEAKTGRVDYYFFLSRERAIRQDGSWMAGSFVWLTPLADGRCLFQATKPLPAAALPGYKDIAFTQGKRTNSRAYHVEAMERIAQVLEGGQAASITLPKGLARRVKGEWYAFRAATGRLRISQVREADEGGNLVTLTFWPHAVFKSLRRALGLPVPEVVALDPTTLQPVGG